MTLGNGGVVTGTTHDECTRKRMTFFLSKHSSKSNKHSFYVHTFIHKTIALGRERDSVY